MIQEELAVSSRVLGGAAVLVSVLFSDRGSNMNNVGPDPTPDELKKEHPSLPCQVNAACRLQTSS